MATTWYEADRHEASRIIAFSDGVVAIAITLLILPLADLELPQSGEGAANPLGYIWQENSSLITSFLITWLVIVGFWLLHHRMFGALRQVNNRIIVLNIVWLFGIVILPFPMNLVDQVNNLTIPNSGDRQVVTFYLATMFVISLCMSLISEQIRAHPELMTEEARATALPTRLKTWVLTVYLGCVTITALFAPQAALWALIGLAFVRPVIDGIVRPPSKKKRWAPPSKTDSGDPHN